mmetsp:Transcript_107632/g.213875  ORF Transcript_107632/g.213875 Transcript_107632/m.213875 type:complete len:219 (-) Transcript_107632:13-669(-)
MVMPSAVLVMPEMTFVKPSSSTCVSLASCFLCSSPSSYLTIHSSTSRRRANGSQYISLAARNCSFSSLGGSGKAAMPHILPVAALSALSRLVASLKMTRAKLTWLRIPSTRCQAFVPFFSINFSSTASTKPKQAPKQRFNCSSVTKPSKCVTNSVRPRPTASPSLPCSSSCFTNKFLLMAMPGATGKRSSRKPRTSCVPTPCCNFASTALCSITASIA